MRVRRGDQGPEDLAFQEGMLTVKRSTPMRRSGRLKRTRMRRSSGKAKGLRLDRRAWKGRVAELRARAGGRCENPECCRLGYHDPHHIIKRSQGGTDDLENLAYLCRSCHERTDLPKAHPRYLKIVKVDEPITT